MFFIHTGVLQLMEIGDVQRKDIVDHPENYTLLTTLDEGLFPDSFLISRFWKYFNLVKLILGFW